MEFQYAGYLRAAILLVLTATIYFCVCLFNARRSFRRLHQDGLPMPPHHPIFGHLLLTVSIMGGLPSDASSTYLAHQFRLRYPHLDKAFYLDYWPFSSTMLVVLSPELISQFTQDNNQAKFEALKTFMKPLSDGREILTMEGEEWKHWRHIFSTGFKAKEVMDMLPELVDNVIIFRNFLRDHARTGNTFSLSPLTLNLAMDMAGKAIWNHEFNSQRAYNTMTSAVVSQLKWLQFTTNSLSRVNIIRPVVHRYNSYRMNKYIDAVLRQTDHANGTSVIHRAYQTYVSNQTDDEDASRFSDILRSQMKFFLLAGYDTTASTIVYVLHLLYSHPEVLARVREEHDSVFGADIATAPALISAKPHLLNQLPHTTAAIRETLRLFPPAASVRAGSEGFSLHDHSTGQAYPTSGCMIWSNHFALHHNPRYWRRAEDFLPERFLVQATHELYPVKNAWRPFEAGPRNCIAQELAMMELRLVCVLVLREFDLAHAYEELDARNGYKEGATRPNVNGERVYQVTKGGGAHPSDSYPCKASFAHAGDASKT